MSIVDAERWPNHMDFKAKGGQGSTKGIERFFADEILRRHDLVREKLAAADCDALIVQGHFPPSVMGAHPEVAWLSGSTGYCGAVTLTMPRAGELQVLKGRKPSSAETRISPYLLSDDTTLHIRDLRRIAYADIGNLSVQFTEEAARVPDAYSTELFVLQCGLNQDITAYR